MPTEYATHKIDGLDLDIIFDHHPDGTWTAAWFFPGVLVCPTDSDGLRGGFVSQAEAEDAVIAWAREHGVAYLRSASPTEAAHV